MIVASAFGADAIRRDGHAFWAAAAARAGANGFEVRRELFADEADAAPDAPAPARRRDPRARPVGRVFDARDAVRRPTAARRSAALDLALDEAAALDARIVKLQLGGSSTGTATDAGTLDRALRRFEIRRASGRGKRPVGAGGTIDAFASLFSALPRSAARGSA